MTSDEMLKKLDDHMQKIHKGKYEDLLLEQPFEKFFEDMTIMFEDINNPKRKIKKEVLTRLLREIEQYGFTSAKLKEMF